MTRTIIGVMGPGEGAKEADIIAARRLGALIAAQGWVTLCGGRGCGVMDAVAQGAHEAGGLTIGILPSKDTTGLSSAVDLDPQQFALGRRVQ